MMMSEKLKMVMSNMASTFGITKHVKVSDMYN